MDLMDNHHNESDSSREEQEGMESLSAHPTVQRYNRHVSPTMIKVLGLLKMGRVFVHAKDVWIEDSHGNRYLDANAGFGAVNIGHNHPRLAKRLHQFLDEEPLNLCHMGPGAQTADLAAALADRLGDALSVSVFTNSGAEAVEAGMKLARLATARKKILYCDDSYHGLNLGTLSVMGDERLQEPFLPLLPGCEAIPFGDLESLEQKLTARDCAAFLVEPIQCEGGIILPPNGYLAKAQELCRKYETVLILDEVQTGIGRTGSFCAFQQEGFVPDVLLLAKSLGGSLTTIGATITNPELHQKAFGPMDRFELPFSTFGGNSLACAAGLETLSILEDEGMIENCRERGEQLLAGLKERLSGHPFVRDVRGRGLLVAVDLGPTSQGFLNRLWPSLVQKVMDNVLGVWIVSRMLENGLMGALATHHWNILRLEPPLTITKEQIDTIIDKVSRALEEYQSIPKVLKDFGARVGSQWWRGWEL